MIPKHRRFVAEYKVDRNQTQAAIRAGYPKRSARQQAARLMTNAAIRAAIEADTVKAEGKAGITQERVLSELALLAFSDLTHYSVSDDGDVELTAAAPAGAMRALQSIKRRITITGIGDAARTTTEVEIKLWDKPGPLKLAGRHVGVKGFHDRVEVTDPDGKPVTFTLSLDARDR